MEAEFTLKVNGQARIVRVDPATPLLYVLRDDLGLNGPKFGCGLQQCGSCMVLLDTIAWPSCQLPVANVQNAAITTLEGLTRPDGSLHPVQQAFVEEQAAQCGFCLNGMVISAVALLTVHPKPDDQTIRNALYRVLCRCGVHSRALAAIKKAADSSKS